MAYPALELINRAYYLSQVVSRELQTVSGTQVADGLYLLNALLDYKSTDLRLIPYFTYYEFDTVAGQEKYTIPNLDFVDTMTFNIGSVRYPMTDQTRNQYFATGRVDNINSLPFSYRCERKLGGMDIYMYFNPAQVYQVKLWGKFNLTEVTLSTDLSTVYDTYYIEYLRFSLAEYICCEYGATLPDQTAKMLASMQKKLMDVSPADLSVRKQSFYNKGWSYDWQSINLTEGFVPF